MNYIVMRIKNNISDLKYSVSIIAYSENLRLDHNLSDDEMAEINFINLKILDENQILSSGKLFLTEFLSKNPLKVRLIDELKSEVDAIIITKS